ncbi:LlaJI family restriction endonuclease [Bacillus suaedaesalsae]|uniref:LlaJI family restriction endonuclease n=1 Tax=Bacillus suaedaesalsae TaxID=2810349 RepID=A0ABS2DEU9_9BACI|nr:LlaJI family restriction endonuclease [Bacillus suaedaesalsae]MBM6616985.1 LlaJI family restriction endonuclease [Bacillus suaedaesalsae]
MNTLLVETYSEYELKDSNIGIEIIKGKPRIIFPRGFEFNQTSPSLLRKEIITLISVLEKYKKKLLQNNIEEKNQKLLDNFGDQFQFKTYLWLLRDYMEHGYFVETERFYKDAKSGKIDFARTIKKHKPYLSGKNIVYTDFVVSQKRTDVNSAINLIHRYTIEKSYNNAGWLFGNIQLERNIRLTFSKNEALSIINKELSSTFQDRKRNLLNNLKQFFLGNDLEGKETAKELKAKNFEHVWEEMLRVIYGNQDNELYNSKSTWFKPTGGKIKTNANTMPDIIYKLENKAYVLDAKYYGYWFDGYGLPGTSDINKQIGYSQAIVRNGHADEAVDAFLLPYQNERDLIQYFGAAKSEISPDDKVHGIFVDIRSIMELYLKRTSYDQYRDELIALIDQYE